MQQIARLLAVCLCILTAAASNARDAAEQKVVEGNPIEKVLELIGNLQAKVIREGEAEQKTYDEFAEWCEDESKQKQFEIKTGTANSEELKATIAKATSDIEQADDSIADLSSAVATANADLKAATEIREKEKADFTKVEVDLVDTVDILERAIGILEREMAKHAAAFVQLTANAKNLEQALSAIVEAGSLSTGDKATLTSLVQAHAGSKDEAESTSEEFGSSDMYAALGAPDPAAYKGHSNGIIDVLEDMLGKAETQLADARKEEMTAQHNYELLKQSLEDEIANNEKNMADTKKAMATAAETKATAEGDLAVTTKDLNEDTAYLGNIHQDCMQKAQDFEAAVKSRDAELEALATAKKVIKEATAGGGEVVYGAGASFLQFAERDAVSMGSGLHTGVDLANFEVVEKLKKLAEETHSAALNQLAMRIRSVMRHGASSGDDPFAKVKGLIKEMIERLLDEAKAEASHKAYCDEEMAETKEKMGDLQTTIDKLNTNVDSETAQIAKLKEEVAELSNQLVELAKSQAEMDAIRQKEHDEFVSNKKEMHEGLDGVQLALKVLREYYANADDAHGKASGAGGGIIGLLEVIESDFGRSLAEANAAEDSAQSEYDRISKENAITKVTKEQDVKYKTKERKGLEKSVAEARSDLIAAETENAAVLEYMDKLKKQCIAKPMPYEERKKRREAEIAGLKEALAILEGEAVLLQRGRSNHFLKRH